MNKITDTSFIKRNLIVASLYITSYEMLKFSIINRVRGFLCDKSKVNSQGEFDYEISDDYRKQVLERDKHPLHSSCLWLKDNNIIDQSDIDGLQEMREHRDLIAHQLLKILVDDDININIELLKKTQELLIKIEKNWVVNFDLALNPDIDGQEFDENQVKPGAVIFINYLMEIVNDELKN